MKHEEMKIKDREKAELSFNNSKVYKIELMTKEPFIEVEDGTKFYIDVIE